MPARSSNAEWNGDLKSGKGTMKLGGGAWEGAYSFGSRFENGKGTNPEELIAAAHAGCFSMALAGALAKAGHDPKRVVTTAKVNLNMGEGGPKIDRIDLTTEAEVPDIEDSEFQEIAEGAKTGCPVSRALEAVEIKLNATLKG